MTHVHNRCELHFQTYRHTSHTLFPPRSKYAPDRTGGDVPPRLDGRLMVVLVVVPWCGGVAKGRCSRAPSGIFELGSERGQMSFYVFTCCTISE